MLKAKNRNIRHTRFGDAATETDRRDLESTANGSTFQILISCRDRRRPELWRRLAMLPTTIDKEMSLLENDRMRIQTFMNEQFRDSRLPDRVDDFPRYDSKTLVKGSLLGNGTFCSVYKFRRGTLCNKDGMDETSSTSESSNFEPSVDENPRTVTASKPFLSQLRKVWGSLHHCKMTPKYAIKTINKDIDSKELMVRSVAYLAAETRMLAGVDHPHIIRLCGWGSRSSQSSMVQSNGNDVDGKPIFEYGHFIVVERLHHILKKQLKEWEFERRNKAVFFEAGKRYPEDAKIIGASSVSHKYKWNRQIDFMNRLYNDRIEVAVQLSSAIVYLHERNLLHRDIKPQNIGFDAEGNVKLFDFGLAKEIILEGEAHPKNTSDNTHDDVNERLFNLTGLAGSRPYMSPENGRYQPYNAKTDVYSFSMVLWELMTLRKLPHRRYSNFELDRHVWKGPNYERPFLTSIMGTPVPPSCCDISEKMGDDSPFLVERPIRELLQKCWSPSIDERPTMKSVHQTLRTHLSEIAGLTTNWRQ